MTDSLIFTTNYVIVAKRVPAPRNYAIQEYGKFFDDFKATKVSKEELPNFDEKDHIIIPMIDDAGTESTEAEFYFVFDRQSILSSDITTKLFKAHKSSFSKGFRDDFSKAFMKYNVLINDLKRLNMYKVSVYKLDGAKTSILSDRLISLYELIVHSLEASGNEILAIKESVDLSKGIDTYMQEFFSSIDEKILNALQENYTVTDFDEFIEVALPDGIETYNKALLFKEMLDSSNKDSVKEALSKALDKIFLQS